MIGRVRNWWSATTNRLMARCRVCGRREDVIGYDPRGLWAFFVRKTWCPEHCPDHDYRYERGAGHYCWNCGQEPPLDWFVERSD